MKLRKSKTAKEKAQAARKRNLWQKYIAAKRLTADELQEIGIRGNDVPVPLVVQGLAGIAREIAATLRIQCSRQYVRAWRTRRPPFPSPDQNNRYEVGPCLDWVRANILKSSNGDTQPGLFELAATVRANGEIAAEEHLEWQRQIEKGAWVKRSDFERAMKAAGRIVQTLFDREVESDGPKAGAAELRNLGVAETIIEKWQQKMIVRGVAWTDSRRRQFSKAAAG